MTRHFPTDHTARIRALNDEFRRLGPALSVLKFDGLWLVTQGIPALGHAVVLPEPVGIELDTTPLAERFGR